MRELAERIVSTTMLILVLTDFRIFLFDMSILGRMVTTVVAMVLFGFIEFTVHKNLHNDITKSPYHKKHHTAPNSLPNQIVTFETIASGFAGLWVLKMLGVVTGFFAKELLISYLLYEIFHTLTHAYPDLVPRATLWHTTRHHKTSGKNFGVTTRGWDRAFGTAIEGKIQTDDHIQRILDFIPVVGFVCETVTDRLKGYTPPPKPKSDDDATRTEPPQTEIQPAN